MVRELTQYIEHTEHGLEHPGGLLKSLGRFAEKIAVPAVALAVGLYFIRAIMNNRSRQTPSAA